MPFTLTLWTNDPGLAQRADLAGVDRIGLDLETLGKKARQAGLPTWVSQHTPSDLPAIRGAVKRASLFVRCNPLNPRSKEEIDLLVAHGVDVLMLPNFEDLADVRHFLQLVNGRMYVVPLVERLRAARAVRQFVEIPEIKEIHIGLNDLSIDLGLENRLAALATDLLAEVADATRAAGLRLSIGGVARALDQDLPVPSDLVYAQCARLGATGALIARSFRPHDLDTHEFAIEVQRLRTRMAYWQQAAKEELECARQELERVVSAGNALKGEIG